MNDNYFHVDSSVMYIYENIPGPADSSEDYKQLLDNFNSQISKHCQCEVFCEDPTCECLKVNKKLTNLGISSEHGVTLNECNSLCTCTTQCINRVVQKGPIENLIVKVCDNPLKGMGLFSSTKILKNTFICEYAGEVITRLEAEKRQEENKEKGRMNYILCLNEHCNDNIFQTFVDPSSFGNIGRYINHSCEPNCYIIPVRVDSLVPKLAIFTNSEIMPNKELCFDYGCNSFISDNLMEKKPCLCESKMCRNFMPFSDY